MGVWDANGTGKEKRDTSRRLSQLLDMNTSENQEAAFIAKVTAGATHELRNILAIVKESAGLIEDVVNAADDLGAPSHERIARSVDRIRAQVIRGTEFLSNLNRFAHSLDHAEERLDLSDEAKQAAFLCQRFARQKRQAIEVRPGDPDLTVVANALWLQMVLFTAVQCCLEQLPDGGTVTMCARRHGDRPSVEFSGDTEDHTVTASPADAPVWSGLVEMVERVGGSVEWPDAEYRFRIMLPPAGPG